MKEQFEFFAECTIELILMIIRFREMNNFDLMTRSSCSVYFAPLLHRSKIAHMLFQFADNYTINLKAKSN